MIDRNSTVVTELLSMDLQSPEKSSVAPRAGDKRFPRQGPEFRRPTVIEVRRDRHDPGKRHFAHRGRRLAAASGALRAHQAACGVADRLHRGDRDVPGDAGDGRVPAADLRRDRHRAGGRCCCRLQLPAGAEDRRADGPHPRTTAADGPAHFRRGARIRGRRWRCRPRLAVPARQPADHVARGCNLHGLRDRVHGGPQAAHPAEHRARRRGGRDAAGARLDRGDGRGFGRRAAALPDHLRLDAAALLVARALSQEGVCEGRCADAAGDARRARHAPARAAVHGGPVRGEPAAVLRGHERAALPRGRARAGRGLPGVRGQALPELQRPAGTRHLPLLDRVSRAAVRGASGRSLPMKKHALLLIAIAALAGCTEGVLDPKGPVAAAERQILFNALGIMLAIVIPTILATLGVAAWFRASNRRARYLPDFEYSGRLEVLVWSIPAMTVILVGGVAWLGSHDLDPRKAIASTAKPIRVQVVSLDWKWLFIYPDQGIATVNQLTIPVGTPVNFELTSSGVMNSFFVPQLGSQIYTMAGMVTRVHLQADHPGIYRGLSAQFSGDGFSDMRFTVDAVPAQQFEQWVTTTRNSGPVLDAQTYADLAKPSNAVVPFTYRAVASDLFNDIVSSGMQPADPSQLTHPASQRTER